MILIRQAGKLHAVPRPLTKAIFLLLLGSLLLCGRRKAIGANVPWEERQQHWAFKMAVKPAVPRVHSPVQVRNELDSFIQARLEQEGLSPSTEADKGTLLRRLYFDLRGLPPSPAESAAFLSDPSPDAYERLIDELLASPRYGERWARYWLDVVHYGESHGYDKDKPRPNAWPYRDYVIGALNRDLPYSRFVQEQIAGDVLFPDDPQATVATGFIAAGPWDFVGHVELPESKTDGLIARYNDRDDMVMTTMSTFLSLTVHCARCHDHKFDPIRQRDYYGMQAVFAGVDRAERPFDSDPQVFMRRKSLLAKKRALVGEQAEIKKQIGEFSTTELAALDAKLDSTKKEMERLPKLSLQSPSNGYHSGIEAKAEVEKWVQVDLGETLSVTNVVLVPARPTDFADTPGFGFPVRFRVDIFDNEDLSGANPLLDATAEDYKNPADGPVVIPAAAKGRFIRVTATRLWERTKDYVFALGELQVFGNGTNLALGKKVTALDSIDSGRWHTKFLVDNYDSRKPLQFSEKDAAAARQRELLEAALKVLIEQREAELEKSLPTELKGRRERVQAGLKETEAELSGLPRPKMVYAGANDFAASGSFHPASPPRAVYLLARGDVKSPRELMNPSALSSIPTLPSAFNLSTNAPDEERRGALAKWLTATNNLLLRRSIVNRIWQYHFGRGLVDSPNDFGHMGSQPTHPELLDWLAYWFTENGESLKKLHKLILMSHAWRQASADNAEFAKRDSENRLLWRMNRSRLDAECLRDTALALSGKLDFRMGGPSDQQFFFKDDHSPIYDYTRFDVESTNACRRSIYRFIVRSVPDPFMESLDCADPSLLVAKRNNTLTALQALATMNNAFMVRQAELFAARLQREKSSVDEQITLAFQLALARDPTAAELDKLSGYARSEGLPNFCRLLLNLNEFVFVD